MNMGRVTSIIVFATPLWFVLPSRLRSYYDGPLLVATTKKITFKMEIALLLALQAMQPLGK